MSAVAEADAAGLEVEEVAGLPLGVPPVGVGAEPVATDADVLEHAASAEAVIPMEAAPRIDRRDMSADDEKTI